MHGKQFVKSPSRLPRRNLVDTKIPFGVSDIFLTLTHRHTYTGGHLRPQGSVNNMDTIAIFDTWIRRVVPFDQQPPG